mmetsp:Transcript_10741/g.40354  ORF Transcript_10741/g.40354 Transcript_10741/m.40354 type:complete len:282 (+) Transcript_10741:838-1683(+)
MASTRTWSSVFAVSASAASAFASSILLACFFAVSDCTASSFPISFSSCFLPSGWSSASVDFAAYSMASAYSTTPAFVTRTEGFRRILRRSRRDRFSRFSPLSKRMSKRKRHTAVGFSATGARPAFLPRGLLARLWKGRSAGGVVFRSTATTSASKIASVSAGTALLMHSTTSGKRSVLSSELRENMRTVRISTLAPSARPMCTWARMPSYLYSHRKGLVPKLLKSASYVLCILASIGFSGIPTCRLRPSFRSITASFSGPTTHSRCSRSFGMQTSRFGHML